MRPLKVVKHLGMARRFTPAASGLGDHPRRGDGGQGHDLLIEFLSKHYPREQFKPQEIVRGLLRL